MFKSKFNFYLYKQQNYFIWMKCKYCKNCNNAKNKASQKTLNLKKVSIAAEIK